MKMLNAYRTEESEMHLRLSRTVKKEKSPSPCQSGPGKVKGGNFLSDPNSGGFFQFDPEQS